MTKNFPRHEIECKCGCGAVIEDEVFMHTLQGLRDMYGRPMIVSSGYRCEKHNKAVGGAAINGPHTIAAVDIIVHGRDAYELLWMAIAKGFTGIGLNQKGRYDQRFIHMDRIRRAGRPWVWTY